MVHLQTLTENRDSLLRDKVQEILEIHKALTFAGFTHMSPRVISYVRADKAFNPEPDSYGHEESTRGRSAPRSNQETGKDIRSQFCDLFHNDILTTTLMTC